MKHIPRLFTADTVETGKEIFLSAEQMYHLTKVLRLKENDTVYLFNNVCGEWICKLKDLKKGTAVAQELRFAPREEVGPALACAIIHPVKFALMAEKVTELGVSEIFPIITEFTQHKSLNQGKIEKIIVQACEQCGRLSIPRLHNPEYLDKFLGKVLSMYNYRLLVGVEKKECPPLIKCLQEKVVFLVGPEGGFSDEEIKTLCKSGGVDPFYFGKNILRSETAAISFISSWQLKYS